MTTKSRVLIYGATGYMGRMIARLAEKVSNLPVVLAARNRDRLAELAGSLDLPFRVITLETPKERDDRLERERRRPLVPRGARAKQGDARSRDRKNAALDRALVDVKVVLNAAGPFAETAMPLARACIRTGTDYVDIGGEFDVLNELNNLHVEARNAETVLMPGVGLTVMASDSLVRKGIDEAKPRGLERPHVVRVALSRAPFVSRGSAKTMLASVRDGVRIVRNEAYERVPVGTLVRSFSFEHNPRANAPDTRLCTAITLADMLTVGKTAQYAWGGPGEGNPHRTPNVETYVEASNLERIGYELGGELSLALRSRPLKGLLDRALSMWPEGPGPEDRDRSGQHVAVEIEDRYRRGVEVRLSTDNSYDFTARAAIVVVSSLLQRKKGGAEYGAGIEGFTSPAWAADLGPLWRALVPPQSKYSVVGKGLDP